MYVFAGINSSNSLAYLASLTLQKALNINSNSCNVKSTSSSNASCTALCTTLSPSSKSNRKISAPANISTSLCITSTNSSSSLLVGAAAEKVALAATSSPAVASSSSSSSSTSVNHNKHSFKIPSDILDDLASRFIINVPDMELSNLIRICFQIELAHWFYLDFFCASQEEKQLQPCGIKQFAMQIFQVCMPRCLIPLDYYSEL